MIGKDVEILAKKKERTAMDAKVLSEYGRLILLVSREQRVADEDEADDLNEDEVAQLLIKTVGTTKLIQSLKDLGAL